MKSKEAEFTMPQRCKLNIAESVRLLQFLYKLIELDGNANLTWTFFTSPAADFQTTLNRWDLAQLLPDSPPLLQTVELLDSITQPSGLI